ncbi:RCC1 domain-containing protein [Bradymonas sediminis]|uniref:RCC1 domain-containing protein n=1 Tax=Bradymonas sediminis TaxID=1548548 RepID=UPI00105BC328|nr:RCC1 domain-containing protein [Bradymonas sediminis]
MTDEREIRCWGDNSACGLGQQAPGRGVGDYRYMPQPPIAEIPANWEHLSGQCVLSEDGDIWCWGLRATNEDPVWPIRCEPTAQRMLTF